MAGLCLFIGLCTTPVTQAWFDCNWPYRTEVTITENSGTTLTDYQVLLTLSAADFNPAYVWSSDGRDLRILDTDDSTVLSFFIESWDQAGQTAEVWVQFASLAANANRLIYLYYGNTSAGSASTGLTFTDPGIRFHTRRSNANPNNKTAAFNAFNSANDNVAGYGCTFITNFTGINNRNQFSPPSRNRNFGALSESFFEVLPGEEGVWGFRYGADFGRGGGLYVDDVALEEQWNDDLWWAFNWNAANEVLQGTINLTAGFHKLEVIGFEGCCDGGITVQYMRPGGSYQTFNTASINIRSRKCPVTEPTFAAGTQGSQSPLLEISKSSSVVEDPFNGSANPKSIPGSRVRYNISVSNQGDGTSDEDSISIVDPIPANSRLYVQGAAPFGFTDGTPSSGLNLNFVDLANTGDDVAFSDDNGGSFNYTPSPGGDGSDANVTHIRITPSGRMACGGGPDAPDFTTSFDVIMD